MDFSPIITDYNRPNNLFSCIAINDDTQIIYNKVELLNPFITEFPRITDEDTPLQRFAFTFFENDKVAFSPNQDSIAILSNELFSGSKTLGEFEQLILNRTYEKSLRTEPLRPNRL